MRIAFATRDCEHVNEQLRRAPHLVVCEVTTAGYRVERTFAFASGGTDDRIRAIAGVAIVFVSAVGPSVAARLASCGIRAATAPVGTPIHQLLAELHGVLAAREPGAHDDGAR